MLTRVTHPSGALWLRVDIGHSTAEFLIGPDVLDIESIVDTSVVLTLGDGRSWQVRMMTAVAVIDEIARWRETAGPGHLMTYTDLLVVDRAGVEAMSEALAEAIDGI